MECIPESGIGLSRLIPPLNIKADIIQYYTLFAVDQTTLLYPSCDWNSGIRFTRDYNYTTFNKQREQHAIYLFNEYKS